MQEHSSATEREEQQWPVFVTLIGSSCEFLFGNLDGVPADDDVGATSSRMANCTCVATTAQITVCGPNPTGSSQAG